MTVIHAPIPNLRYLKCLQITKLPDGFELKRATLEIVVPFENCFAEPFCWNSGNDTWLAFFGGS